MNVVVVAEMPLEDAELLLGRCEQVTSIVQVVEVKNLIFGAYDKDALYQVAR